MGKLIARRDFLRLLMAGATGLALEQYLAACNPVPEAAPALPTPEASPTELQESTQGETISETPTATTANTPDLVVVRGGEPEVMLQHALASFGGMSAFVTPGSKVVIKPNICVAYNTYEYASTTNPWVVGTLVKLCLEAGSENVTVFDFPFGGTAEDAYGRSGIREQVEANGGKMEIMSYLKFNSTQIPNALDLKETEAYQEALDADVLINVPIAKHHGSTRLTLGLKNLMGLVLDRGALHVNLGQRIADLGSLFRPKLTGIDAVRILTANGPTGGDLNDVKKLDTIIISPDIVAADSFATSLFGLTPSDIDYISSAASIGLGRMDLENLNIEEINLS